MMRIRKGGVYRFNPVMIDRFGLARHSIAIGEHVKVGPVPGMRAPTVNANHVHVYRLADNSHCGFIHVNSLERIS